MRDPVSAFGDDPRLGIGLVGLSYLSSDDDLREPAQALSLVSADR
jgi:hypothetical protein